jgi:hypothetical protein
MFPKVPKIFRRAPGPSRWMRRHRRPAHGKRRSRRGNGLLSRNGPSPEYTLVLRLWNFLKF